MINARTQFLRGHGSRAYCQRVLVELRVQDFMVEYHRAHRRSAIKFLSGELGLDVSGERYVGTDIAVVRIEGSKRRRRNDGHRQTQRGAPSYAQRPPNKSK